jgi:hypothetical protein
VDGAGNLARSEGEIMTYRSASDSVRIQSPAELRARIRALRDLTGNRKVANNEVIRNLIEMHRETAHRDIHVRLGGRAVNREAVRRGIVSRDDFRSHVRNDVARSTYKQDLQHSV